MYVMATILKSFHANNRFHAMESYSMKCEFDWHTNIDQETRKSTEDEITEDLGSAHSPVKACHGGPVRVTLSCADALNETIVGNVKCKCGAPIGVINGASDGSKVTYSAVEK